MQLDRIEASKPQAVVHWGDAEDSARVLNEMRARGMNQPYFCSDRCVSEEFVRIAGENAEGVLCGYPWDPTRKDPKLETFRQAFQKRWGAAPETYAAHAYDGMNLLLWAIGHAGLNRAKIRDVLAYLPEPWPGITGDIQLSAALDDVGDVYLAIAAFQASLISLNSRYDQYAHGYHDALTDNEIEGMNVFRSFVARCAECHTPPLFTNQQIAVIGVQEPEGHPFDEGAASVTGIPGLRGGFKIPSLRNVAKTAPYMHSGTFHELRDAARFYTLGRGHALPEEEKTRMIVHWHIWEPQLTDEELDRLVAFLATLTDESFKPQIPSTVPSGLLPVGTVPEALARRLSRAD